MLKYTFICSNDPSEEVAQFCIPLGGFPFVGHMDVEQRLGARSDTRLPSARPVSPADQGELGYGHRLSG